MSVGLHKILIPFAQYSPTSGKGCCCGDAVASSYDGGGSSSSRMAAPPELAAPQSTTVVTTSGLSHGCAPYHVVADCAMKPEIFLSKSSLTFAETQRAHAQLPVWEKDAMWRTTYGQGEVEIERQHRLLFGRLRRTRQIHQVPAGWRCGTGSVSTAPWRSKCFLQLCLLHQQFEVYKIDLHAQFAMLLAAPKLVACGVMIFRSGQMKFS